MKKILYVTHKRRIFDIARLYQSYEYNNFVKDPRFIVKDIEDKKMDLNVPEKGSISLTTWHALLKKNQNKYGSNAFYRIYDRYDKRFGFIHDLHSYTCGTYDRFTSEINKYFNNVITMYDNFELNKIKHMCPNIKFHRITHHVDTTVNKDYGLKKIYDVTLYGMTGRAAYPFRNRLYNLLYRNIRKVPLRINIVRSLPEWDKHNKHTDITGTALAKMVNQSYITISTKSKFDYLLKKYFEISACRSLVAGDMTKLGEKIWKNNYLEITHKMSDTQILQNLINTVMKLRAGDKALNKKIDTMYNVMHTEYNLDKFNDKLYDIMVHGKKVY